VLVRWCARFSPRSGGGQLLEALESSRRAGGQLYALSVALLLAGSPAPEKKSRAGRAPGIFLGIRSAGGC
jgi:hypothetical protein